MRNNHLSVRLAQKGYEKTLNQQPKNPLCGGGKQRSMLFS
jgi:hypothetical protein